MVGYPLLENLLSKSNPIFPVLLADARAGLGGALIGIPQEINYGLLAIAPLGLLFAGMGISAAFYVSALATLIYVALGASKGQIVGPRPTLVILLSGLFAALLDHGCEPAALPGAAVVAMASSGLLLLIAGRLGFGQLIKYIPLPVLAGFTNGIAALLVISALPMALGIGINHGWPSAFNQLHLGSFLVTGITVFFCIKPVGFKWIRQVPSVLQAMLFAALMDASLLAVFGLERGPHISELALSVPSPVLLMAALKWPGFSLENWLLIGKFALAMSMAAALETLATAAHLDSEERERSSGHDILRRLGLTNLILAPLMIPVAGSLGRSISVLSGGAQTRRAQVFYALFLLLLISITYPWLAQLPQAAIAGVLIVVARNMVGNSLRQGLAEWRAASNAGDRKRAVADFFVMILVALITVFDSFITGLAVGTIAAMGLFIRDQSRSVVRRVSFGDVSRSLRIRSTAARQLQDKYGKEIVVFEAEGVLFFGSVERFIQRIEMAASIATLIVIDLRRVSDIDATASRLLRQTARRYRERGCHLLLAHLPPERHLHEQLLLRSVAIEIPAKHWFADLDAALEYAEDLLLVRHGFSDTALGNFDLHKSDLMAGLTALEISALISYLRPRQLPKGDHLFRQGDLGRSLFIVISGSLSVHLPQTASGTQKRLIAFGPGAVLGEMAVITGAPRSANALADEDSVLMELDNALIERLAADTPALAIAIMRNLSALLADRLRTTTLQLSQLESD
jgi:SulP family sulfate permease